jgi:hypothetical protein
MIPYDDLVVALTAWRARQGLPVATPAATAAAPAATAAATTPPRPPPRSRVTPPMPRPAQRPPAEISDFDDHALVEDASYDDGEDYVMQLGDPAEPTAVSSAQDPAPGSRRDKRW